MSKLFSQCTISREPIPSRQEMGDELDGYQPVAQVEIQPQDNPFGIHARAAGRKFLTTWRKGGKSALASFVFTADDERVTFVIFPPDSRICRLNWAGEVIYE